MEIRRASKDASDGAEAEIGGIFGVESTGCGRVELDGGGEPDGDEFSPGGAPPMGGESVEERMARVEA